MTVHFTIAFFLSFNLLGQTLTDELVKNIHDYRTRRHTWPDQRPPSENYRAIARKIYLDTLNSFCSEPDSAADFSAFHFDDIDGDKDVDVIFQGLECGGFETESAIIYQNINGSLKRTLRTTGRIVIFNKSQEVIVYQYPCCAMTENTFVVYRISTDSINLSGGISFFDSFLLHEKTSAASLNYEQIVPKSPKMTGTVSVNINAIINYVPKDSIIKGTYLKENTIGFTNKRTPARVFSTLIDEKGQKWLYCEFYPNDISSDHRRLNFPILAWVRQKYCS